MIPTLHISLLGNFLLVSGETTVTTVDMPRLQSLLAYLVLHRTSPQYRSRLAYLLWPDSTDAQAHTNLRSLIHRFRQALPNADSFLFIDRHTLQWQPEAPWTLDVLDFELALAQADQAEQVKDRQTARQALAKAMNLYRGELLPSCYDEWILAERDRLRQALIHAVERLIGLLEQERDYPVAIIAAQHLLRHDPLHEDTYRHLMHLYAISGDRAAALRTYHSCVTVLERELAVEPSRATQQAYERLMQMEEQADSLTTSGTTLVTEVPLVGRKPEWVQLQMAWRNAIAGRPHLVMLTGEAGIGKTRLAEELLIWARRQGMATASARCYAAEGELAYAPIVTWLRGEALRTSLSSLAEVWLTEVARLLPELLVEQPDLPRPGPLTESWQRQRMFEAFARATLRGNHSILLLLDDVQWCDHETLECLHYLLRFDPRAPLLLVGTARSEEMTSGHPLVSFLMSLRRDGLVTEVPLNPLTATETAHLAARLARQDLDAAVIAALYQETEGNPLFVVETVRAGVVEKVRTGELSYEDPSARPGTLLPSTVQAVIASRLAQLSPGAHELMSLAAIIGRAFTFDVLAQSSSLNEDRLVQALDELWQRRIVREQGGDAYDFSHEKLREQAYLSLSTARRRLLHRRVGDTLVALNTNNASALDTVSGQIATHYEQASAAEPAIVYYTRAAEVAGRIYANAEALTAFKRALELLRQMIPTEEKGEWKREMSAQCYERMGDILALTGEAQAARDAYHNALVQVPLQDHIRQAGIQRKTAKTVGTQQRYEEALHIYITAETVLGEEPHVSSLEWWQEWIEIQDGKMNVYSSLSRLNEMTELLEKVRPIVQQCGTPTQRAEFFYSSSLIAAERNHYAVTAEMLTEAQAGLAAYEALGNLVNMGWGHSIIGLYHLLQDSLTEAERQYQEGLTMGKRTGDTMLQLRCLGYLALVCRKRGQMEDVQHYISQATTMHPQLRDNIGLNKANLAWIAWREGKMSEARELSRTALREWQLLPTIYPFQWTALLPLIDIALAGKQSAEAVDYVRVLLAPEQLRLPDTLSDILEAAIGTWDDNQPDAAQTYLQQAIVLAQKIRYL